MKILTLQGSPRKKGNTSALLEKYLMGVQENSKDVSVKSVHLDSAKINPCKGCNACQSGKVDFCISNDDMIDIYKDIVESDVIVLASPIYFYTVTAQMKLALDRFYSLFTKVKGKKLVFLTTYGAPDDETSGAVNAINMFKQTCSLSGMDFAGYFGISTGSESFTENAHAQTEVYNLGASLVK